VQLIHLDEIEALPALGGQLQWKPVRHALGISAFGINAYHGAQPGDLVVEEHEDEHQELYVVVSGRARFRSGDDQFEAAAGTLVLFEPAEHRVAHAVEPGTTVLAIGAESARFKPSAWEYGMRATGLTDLGRHEEARAALAEGRAAYPEWGFHFTRARIAAAEGELDEAREQLRLAVEADAAAAGHARADALLAPLL
jgi:mannose-6-phosphate isomerase-like protein (cupin superfamily)